jgi:type I restriction enzyme M protein
MVDRRHRDLTADDIRRIADTYHAWRGEAEGKYRDVPGFCRSATVDEIRKRQWILTPGRYVGTQEEADDSEEFGPLMHKLAGEFREEQAKARELDETIARNLKELGFGG